MAQATCKPSALDEATRAFYARSLRMLREAAIPHLVGGAYALERYTGIARHTKDFDIFVRPNDCARVLERLASDGCFTELTHPHWLGKAHCGDRFIDVIFSSGNGLADVDEDWFRHAAESEVLGEPALLCPAEEIIWTKAYIMERERFDGADIAHLLRACGSGLDWSRLLRRFGTHWRVLYAHLILFDFIYPGEAASIPAAVRAELLSRLAAEDQKGCANPAADASANADPHSVCRGTLLSRAQYLTDIQQWGYRDARLGRGGSMSRREVALWTAAIEGDD